MQGSRSLYRSFFLLSFDGDAFNYQRLDFLWLYTFFVRARIRINKGGGLGIYDQVNFAFRIVSADIPGVQFHKGGISLVKFYLCFTFHEGLSNSIFMDPFSSRSTNSKT